MVAKTGSDFVKRDGRARLSLSVCHFREDLKQKNGKGFACLGQDLDSDLERILSPFFCLQFFCLKSFCFALSVWLRLRRLRRPEDSRALPPAVSERLERLTADLTPAGPKISLCP